MTIAREKERMLRQDLRSRGITDVRVLEAMEEVPREAFLPGGLRKFAYEDTALPIEEGQTISQPFIVGLMTEALGLEGGETVLEVGTGTGYAAAVISRIAGHVYTIERHERLAEGARSRLAELGYDNVEVRHGDGRLGWPEHGPYHGIAVAAGGREVPQRLLEQLRIGGRLVIPVGQSERSQLLVRITRVSDDGFETEILERVSFVPLVAGTSWTDGGAGPASRVATVAAPSTGTSAEEHGAVTLIRECAEPLADIEEAELGGLLERIEDARVVLLGEATHGTSEFHWMRARITRELIQHHGFRIVAVEADWPDAARIDRYVRGLPPTEAREPAFTRFPTWMWRNREVRDFVNWMHAFDADRPPEDRAGFFGLDLYSLFRSIEAVLDYLDRVDPDSARIARERYGCLSPWERDPAIYGRAALTGRYRSCEAEVVGILRELLERRLEYAARDGERFLDAVQNARLVANAERYYRVMYYGSAESWNLRDQHMFDTLSTLLGFHGPDARAVVWAHNSHVGNAAATEMGTRGEHNVGQLSRERWGDEAYLVGFGTDRGTVAAASEWDGPMEIKDLRPAPPGSYEGLFHESALEAGLLPLREPVRPEVRGELERPRLERAIGVIYRPETELQSHYFQASLPHQFDEYVWFDRTRAVRPLGGPELTGVPETYPFGL